MLMLNSEKEVNQILARFSGDTARLRRSPVEFGFMERQGERRDYWRVDRPLENG